MFSFKCIALGAAACLYFGVHPTFASPTSSSNVKVMLRDENFAYYPSDKMVNTVLTRRSEMGLEKRSHATVWACKTSSCTDCSVVFDGSLTSPSACIPADNTACLMFSNLDDANVWYWNHAGCNGNNSNYRGCPPGENGVGAPGTNSIGVHPGC